MNGKQAKKLRKAALGLSAALVQNGKNIVERELAFDQVKSVNRPDSFRGIYRTMKAGVTSGKIKKEVL
jgi:hypothetical protein